MVYIRWLLKSVSAVCWMLLVSVIVLLIQHRHIIMKKEWVMQSGNAGYHVKNCLSPRKYGFRTVDTKKQKFLLTNLCVSSKVIMLICCLFISLSMITMVHTVPWKRLTRTEKLVPLASAISIRIVLSTWRNFVRLNRRWIKLKHTSSTSKWNRRRLWRNTVRRSCHGDHLRKDAIIFSLMKYWKQLENGMENRLHR